ncbi:MAG: hypothetical protein WAK32_07700, partial [Xanthobacteraceae bacterium]
MSAIKLYRGVSIYQVDGSQNWYVRIWNREKQRYIVKATGQTSAAKAREVALSHALALLKAQPVVEPEFTFRHFAIKCISKNQALVGKGERNSNYGRVITWVIQNENWGLMRKFGPHDVRQIKTRDFQDYIEELSRKRPDLRLQRPDCRRSQTSPDRDARGDQRRERSIPACTHGQGDES